MEQWQGPDPSATLPVTPATPADHPGRAVVSIDRERRIPQCSPPTRALTGDRSGNRRPATRGAGIQQLQTHHRKAQGERS